jgi:hypothetical protein
VRTGQALRKALCEADSAMLVPASQSKFCLKSQALRASNSRDLCASVMHRFILESMSDPAGKTQLAGLGTHKEERQRKTQRLPNPEPCVRMCNIT